MKTESKAAENNEGSGDCIFKQDGKAMGAFVRPVSFCDINRAYADTVPVCSSVRTDAGGGGAFARPGRLKAELQTWLQRSLGAVSGCAHINPVCCYRRDTAGAISFNDRL